MKGLSFNKSGMVFYYGVPLAGERKSTTNWSYIPEKISCIDNLYVFYNINGKEDSIYLTTWLVRYFDDWNDELIQKVRTSYQTPSISSQ